MSRNETVTVDRGPASTKGRSRQHNGRTLLVLALAAAVALGIAGLVLARDDVATSPAAPITQDQPGYIGDAKDIMVQRMNEQPAHTGDGKDTFVGGDAKDIMVQRMNEQAAR